MPVSKPSRPTLAELVEQRRSIPPAPPVGKSGALAERFLMPPFSVLDTRKGPWQERKRTWLALGIQSELGRGVNLQPMAAKQLGENLDDYRNTKKNGLLGYSEQSRSHYKSGPAKTYNSGGPSDLMRQMNGEDIKVQSGTSIFDPVLCELVYRWFSPKGGSVLDPFAGGSVRGIVAAKLGRSYDGLELRSEQARANELQMDSICPDGHVTWTIGDARDVTTILPHKYDLLFSCPPYANLERYSDDPRDLSTMDYPAFLEVYREIIASSASLLRDDRFAVFVVGDVRDRTSGGFWNLPGDTVQAFEDAGLYLYNRAVLVTPAGSLPIRVVAQFRKTRKLGNTHQDVLVFVKGDPVRAAEACGEVDVDDLDMPTLPLEGIALEEEGQTVKVIDAPMMEACLICDIARGRARERGEPMPRAWVSTEGGWTKLEDHQTLTYIVGNTPYLSRSVFPDAKQPVVSVTKPKRMRD